MAFSAYSKSGSTGRSGVDGSIVIKGEYQSGKKMVKPEKPSKVDFLPKGIQKNK